MKSYKLSERKIRRIILEHENLMEYVERFVRSQNNPSRSGPVKIEYGRILEEVNTACHCHPEYSWLDRGSEEEFIQWIKN